MMGLRNWVVAILLSAPLVLFLLSNFYNHDPELVSTGFVQYDNATYAGNAIQYTWHEHKGLFYSNRLNDSHNYPQIYFNPQLFVIAGLIRLGIPPGIAIMIFTLISSILFFRIVIAIYDRIKSSDNNRLLNIFLFSWGGGLLCASGFLLHITGFIKDDMLTSLFVLDPAHGWWGLNIGRSLFFSLEAWYHAVFFAVIFFILKKNWQLASLCLFILSLSHPFSGIELLLILLAWVLVEIIIKRNSIPISFLFSIIIILGFHIWYYLVFLNQFPEHLSVFHQYSLNWRYRFYHFIPAYIITGSLLLLAFTIEGFRSFLSKSTNRLFICWALVAFTLANHELFIKPMQPIHFTRGYIWSALFLAGLPGLNQLWSFFSRRKASMLLILCFCLIFISDNLLWIWKNSRRINEQTSITHITKEQESILEFLAGSTLYKDLIVGSDEVIPFLSSVRTKSNIWISHPYNTPFYEAKKSVYLSFIETAQYPNEWLHSRIYFIVNNSNKKEVDRFLQLDGQVKMVHQSQHYSIYLKEP